MLANVEKNGIFLCVLRATEVKNGYSTGENLPSESFFPSIVKDVKRPSCQAQHKPAGGAINCGPEGAEKEKRENEFIKFNCLFWGVIVMIVMQFWEITLFPELHY